jgi:hypothetical protein
MPTEFRFDDLDLREEPASGKFDESDMTIDTCTDLCSQRCTTSANTCTTYYC